MTRQFWAGVLAAYLLYALLAGAAMSRLIPALNLLGAAYAGLTWPVAMGCVAAGATCSNVPPRSWGTWMFSFPPDKEDSE